MNRIDKKKEVAFASNNLNKIFSELKEGKFEDKQLFKFIDRAIDDLKNNAFCGIRIPRRLWPKEYLQKFSIINLWKYNLPNSWRLIYTIKEDRVSILSVVLEWMKHKEYERRFRY